MIFLRFFWHHFYDHDHDHDHVYGTLVFLQLLLLSHFFSDQVAAAFNPFSTKSGLWYLSDDVGAWEYVSLDGSPIYCSWALIAKVEYEGLQDITYNIYRDGNTLTNSKNTNIHEKSACLILDDFLSLYRNSTSEK